MAADEKIVARVKKLLALAAPNSGATLSERESAAVEAAKLIAMHGVTIGSEVKTETKVVYRDRPQQRQPPSPPVPRRSEQDHTSRYDRAWSWRRGIANKSATCADPECNGSISPGDRVWERESSGQTEYLHFDGPCRW